MKPTLYVALEGPILLPDGTTADYARPFLAWARRHFNLVVVSEGTTRTALEVLTRIGEAQTPIRTFVDSKAGLFNPKEEYFWVDGELIPSEIAFLAQYGQHNRFFQTHPEKGVTVDLKTKLEARLRRSQK